MQSGPQMFAQHVLGSPAGATRLVSPLTGAGVGPTDAAPRLSARSAADDDDDLAIRQLTATIRDDDAAASKLRDERAEEHTRVLRKWAFSHPERTAQLRTPPLHVLRAIEASDRDALLGLGAQTSQSYAELLELSSGLLTSERARRVELEDHAREEGQRHATELLALLRERDDAIERAERAEHGWDAAAAAHEAETELMRARVDGLVEEAASSAAEICQLRAHLRAAYTGGYLDDGAAERGGERAGERGGERYVAGHDASASRGAAVGDDDDYAPFLTGPTRRMMPTRDVTGSACAADSPHTAARANAKACRAKAKAASVASRAPGRGSAHASLLAPRARGQHGWRLPRPPRATVGEVLNPIAWR